MKLTSILSLTACFIICSSCSNKKETPKYVNKAKHSIENINALPTKIKYPKNNSYDENRITLGKLLFYDPILSGDKDVACATCHHPKNGYAEFRDISIGVNGIGFASKRVFNSPNTIPFVKRNAHTILNTAFNGIDTLNQYTPENAPMFWDSRVNSLENQAIEPIKSLEEMRGLHFSDTEILTEIVSRLNTIEAYKSLFKEAFKGENTITVENIGKAIAAFERTLVANNSRFDKYMRGHKNAISLSEKEGFELFKKVGCINCHSGSMFSDYKMHVLSVPENEKLIKIDSGFQQQFSFRTPTLRNLRFTAPYMHNGTLTTLEKVLEFYEDLTFKKSRNPNIKVTLIDTLAQKLTLRVKDMALIISFLNTLNDDSFDKTVPKKVPSGLHVGGNIN